MCNWFSCCFSKSSPPVQTAIIPPAPNQKQNSIIPMNSISLVAMRSIENLKEAKLIEIKPAKIVGLDLRNELDGMLMALKLLKETHSIKTELQEIAIPIWHLGKSLDVIMEDFVNQQPVASDRYDQPYDSLCELIKGIEIIKQKKIIHSDEDKESLSCLEESCQNMISTVNGVDESRKFSLLQLLREIRWRTATENKTTSITLLYNSILPEIVEGHATRLKRILINLVTHAVELNREGAVLICVELLSQSQSKGIFRFEVQNTGTDTHESAILTESPSLGICRELITSMNRDTSNQFQGTTSNTVWFTVPLDIDKD